MKIYKTFISHTTVIKIYRHVSINLQNDYDYTNKYKIQDKKHWKFTKKRIQLQKVTNKIRKSYESVDFIWEKCKIHSFQKKKKVTYIAILFFFGGRECSNEIFFYKSELIHDVKIDLKTYST